nr:synaptobrevin, longin-like domain protein [Tanacetum cinerariifolium]
MIAILEKSEHNVDFHQIVDFIEASNIRYALTINPTVYVSHIRQFWSTARIETMNEGTKILATVDGKTRTISKSSIRRNLKLNDEEGISSLPDAELFENLALMGYNILPNQKFTFQKGQYSHQLKFLIHTIIQCLSPKSTGFNEFSSNIATAVVCLATNRVYNFSKMIFDGMVRNVNNKGLKFLMYPRVNSPSFSGLTVPLFATMLVTQGKGPGTPTEPHYTPSPQAQQSPHHDLSSSLHPTTTTKSIPTETLIEIATLRQYFRRATRIAQSKALPTDADGSASLLRDDSQGEAFPTIFGLDVGQDMKNIIKTSALPHDSTPRVTSLDADEGTQDLEISGLKARIKLLEEKYKGSAKLFGDDALIKGRSMEIGEEVGVEKSTERGSNDTEELVNVLTSMDAANILTSRVQPVSVPSVAGVSTIGVPTVSGLVLTVSAIFTTASVEEIARDNQRMNKQIARDTKIARIHAEEELQMMIDGLDRNNELIARHLHEYEQAATDLSIGEKIDLINELVKYQDHHAKILKGMTLEEIKEKFIPVWKQIEDFVPMASKEEGERVKRKGLKLEQGSAKKIKTSEEVSEEDLKEMMQLVHVEEVYVEALQVKHPIIDWEIHSEGKKDYWKIIRLGGHTAVY